MLYTWRLMPIVAVIGLVAVGTSAAGPGATAARLPHTAPFAPGRNVPGRWASVAPGRWPASAAALGSTRLQLNGQRRRAAPVVLARAHGPGSDLPSPTDPSAFDLFQLVRETIIAISQVGDAAADDLLAELQKHVADLKTKILVAGQYLCDGLTDSRVKQVVMRGAVALSNQFDMAMMELAGQGVEWTEPQYALSAFESVLGQQMLDSDLPVQNLDTMDYLRKTDRQLYVLVMVLECLKLYEHRSMLSSPDPDTSS